MRLRIFTDPQQGATYEQLLTVAHTAEECGFDAFFRSDHYARIGGGDGQPGPTDAWVTLAALARETNRIRLGTMVSPATFRLPAQLALIVAQVDVMSGGRVELGLGAGWFEDEHREFGIPFPPSTGERFDWLEEQLQIITGMWATTDRDRFSFSGKHYQVTNNAGLPKPAQVPRPPIIVGGKGTRRMPEIAARFADECNVSFASVAHCAEVFQALDAACVRIGRDPSTIRKSAVQVVCAGRNDQEISSRAAAIGHGIGDEFRQDGAVGTAAEVAEKLLSYGTAGVTTMYLQILDLADIDHIRFIAEEVVPIVQGV